MSEIEGPRILQHTHARARTNTHSPGGSSCSSCPPSSNSAVGSTSMSACTCNLGYTGSNGGACSACPAGTDCECGPALNDILEGEFGLRRRCVCFSLPAPCLRCDWACDGLQLPWRSRHGGSPDAGIVRHRSMRVVHFVHRRPQVRGREVWPAGSCPVAGFSRRLQPLVLCVRAPTVLTACPSCLQACAAAGEMNPYRGLNEWLEWWTDSHLRMYYAKFCQLPPGRSYTCASTRCSRVGARACKSMPARTRTHSRARTHSHVHAQAP